MSRSQQPARPLERTSHQVALVVMCEAVGYDPGDAAAGAVMALNHLIYTHKVDVEHGAALVPSSHPPRCARCGSTPPLTTKGKVWAHVPGERWTPRNGARRCPGSGEDPAVPQAPVVGFTRPDGVEIHARVADVLEAGAAVGNGYLWLHPTTKAYRRL
ncbi:hypothetical protein [Nocardioides sp. Leaf285]|uniref:hypothetical protein n=1 Tax=Nocardioides sp. Leaf285 TaxID=1736322 RepID=UPI0007033E63|nr:hypothetical protein [Nocardioides sp. Leaf285]KQP63118.1 hypothetical protein ASF47_19090 [Nocardioides sp. Leaf285]